MAKVAETVPCLVLAAGASSRCPEGKLLKEFRGRPLLSWTLKTLEEHEAVGEVLLVCGHEGERVGRLGLGFRKVRVAWNQQWESGLASSLRVGLQALPKSSRGALVVLGDTPFFRAETLSQVLPLPGEERIVAPSYSGQLGHPKFFPSWSWPELLQLSGDCGAKSVLRANRDRMRVVEVPDPGILRDFDRAEDFES